VIVWFSTDFVLSIAFCFFLFLLTLSLVGYRVLKEKYGDDLPEDLKAFKVKLEDYVAKLDYWGLKDYQLQASHLG
jgi:hypothetical protein